MKNRSISHQLSAISAQLLFSVLCLLSSAAASAAPVAFDIPASRAPAAIDLFIKQSSTRVVYRHDDLKDIQTNAVTGSHEPNAALALLVAGTKLTISERGGGEFAIGLQKPGAIDGSIRDDAGKPVAGARVTLAGTDQAATTDKRGRFSFEGVAPGQHSLQITADGLQNTRVTDVTVMSGGQHTLSPITIPVKKQGTLELETYTVSAKKNDGTLELDPYAVSGERAKPFVAGNMDIPRTINDAQPYYIFNSATIESSGAADVATFLKERLVANTTAITYGNLGGFNTDGNRSDINLRGLGADKTLILVNGRRVASVAIQNNDRQPDLNGIPLASIERIEVLPSSASGIYGGSAIGGVVNVILKKNYSGGEVRFNYDNAWDTDAGREALSLIYGGSAKGGRTHYLLSAYASKSSTLLLQDRRGLFEGNVARILGNSPTYFFSGSFPWLGAHSNILPSSGTAALVFKPDFGGASLGSTATYIASGTGPQTDRATLVASLRANAGTHDLNLPPTSQGPTGLLRPWGGTPEIRELRGSLRHRFNERIEAFAEFSYNSNATVTISNPLNSPITVPTAAPSNPFTVSVNVQMPYAADLPMTASSVNRAVTIGFVATLPRDWTAEFDYTWSRNDFSFSNATLDFTARAADILNGGFNPFVDSLQFDLGLGRYLGTSSFDGATDLHDFSLRGHGELISLPWGKPKLTFGFQERLARNLPSKSLSILPITTANSQRVSYYQRTSETMSAYAELTVPLVRRGAVKFIHDFQLQAAGRVERFAVETGTQSETILFNRNPVVTTYSGLTRSGMPFFDEDTYRSHNYTLGLRYEPVGGVVLRASQATAFLPPAPNQLSPTSDLSTTTQQVRDPRDQQLYPVRIRTGGNPSLTPQSSESTNVGLIFEPKWRTLAGLRVNVEYYVIEQFNFITTLSATQILEFEVLYPDRVVRNAAGQPIEVNQSFLNLFHRETRGWDASADYFRNISRGTIRAGLTYSRIENLLEQYTKTLPETDAAGYPNESGALRYRMVGNIGWEGRRWSLGWTTRHFPSYQQSGVTGGPQSQRNNGGTAPGSTFYTIAQGGNSVSSQIYHDLVIGYSTGKATPHSIEKGAQRNWRNSWLSDVGIQVGVRNLVGREAPFDAFQANLYFTSPYGDILGRTYWVSLKKAF